MSDAYDLSEGTYGSLRCADPAKQLYLVFSPDCRHCKKVIDALSNCNSCDFHLNPIERLKDFKLDFIELSNSYKPEVNRLVLSLLGIGQVPVLLAKSGQSWHVIKGEGNIVNYITRACFETQPTLFLERPLDPTDQTAMSVITEEDGECSVKIDCEPVPPQPDDGSGMEQPQRQE